MLDLWKTPQDVTLEASLVWQCIIGCSLRILNDRKAQTTLLERNAKFVRTLDHRDTPKELKRRLTTAPVLSHPDIHKSSQCTVMHHNKVEEVF